MKLSKELAELYYSAADARKVLGIDEDTFQYWGKTERVKRVYLPGRRHPVYSKQAINKLAGQIEATMLAERAIGLEYRKATVNDMDAEVELACLVFGSRAGLPEAVALRRAFREKNPDSTYHLYDGDHLVAYINIFPLEHQAIEQFKEGTRGWLLGAENVETFDPGKPLECIIIDLATTPTVPPARRGTYAQILLENFSRTLTSWGESGIEIAKVYAASNTPSGIRIIRHAGFSTFKEVSTGRFTFELDIESSENRMLLEYKEALNDWKQRRQTSVTSPSKGRAKKPSRTHVGAEV
ncbi:hypothetical protein [Dictyobacter formicarum]|uniref:N-acetyltransferase domain-containing protein n=1 Tax=Dictyobacter formicarum TaxID=2778368 RepID=A0ABQ3VBA9_9CHLR|nr:hypothetical protein [Dictyobacter formicarum]GHO83245.1 hypothetical protein KSZ_12510 [Dictyobacter formicarum]